jgi:pimeloyl-ACP methyl ester carboxylesterase
MAPLVLVHGNPETAAVWDHLAPSLEARPGSGALVAAWLRRSGAA